MYDRNGIILRSFWSSHQRGAYDNNLSLPICPKCNDTQYVTTDCILTCNPPIYVYECTDCNFKWQSQ